MYLKHRPGFLTILDILKYKILAFENSVKQCANCIGLQHCVTQLEEQVKKAEREGEVYVQHIVDGTFKQL